MQKKPVVLAEAENVVTGSRTTYKTLDHPCRGVLVLGASAVTEAKLILNATSIAEVSVSSSNTIAGAVAIALDLPSGQYAIEAAGSGIIAVSATIFPIGY